MLQLPLMKQVISFTFRVGGAIAFLIPINPLDSAAAEEVKVVPAVADSSVKSSVLKSKTGWYVTAGAGFSEDPSITDSRTSSAYSPRLGREIFQDRRGDVDHGDGVAVEAGVGYDFGNRLRAELTYLYSASSLGSQKYSGSISYAGGGDTFSGQADVSGRINRNSILASLYYDVPTNTRWVPYVGAGLGYTNVSTSDKVYNYDVVLGSGARATGSDTVSGGSGSAFGYQAKIGLSYLASNSTDIFVEGSYFGNTSVDLGTGTTLSGFSGFGVNAGFRYRFGK